MHRYSCLFENRKQSPMFTHKNVFGRPFTRYNETKLFGIIKCSRNIGSNKSCRLVPKPWNPNDRSFPIQFLQVLISDCNYNRWYGDLIDNAIHDIGMSRHISTKTLKFKLPNLLNLT